MTSIANLSEYRALRERLGKPSPSTPVVDVRPGQRCEAKPVPPVEDPSKIFVDRCFEAHPDLPKVVLKRDRVRIIIQEVSRKYAISCDDIISDSRKPHIIPARHETFWRARHELSLSYPKIGTKIGGKDHTTVIHGCRRHEQRIRDWVSNPGGRSSTAPAGVEKY